MHMISHMPSKVLKLLEFVGFSGDRAQGFAELEQSTQMTDGLRCPLAALIMLVYQTYIEHIFGLGEGDLDCVENLLDYCLKSAFFLLFLGRLEQLRGNIDEAVKNFKKCIEIQDEWKQFHNICYWELLWCHSVVLTSVRCDWHNSAKYADILRRQCKWSPGTYTYQYATFLYMIMIEEKQYQLNDQIEDLLRTVPKLKIRYAGKTVPAEKFAITQSEKYFAQNNTLLLPALEFLYIWNIFAAIGNSPKLLTPILERIDKALDEHKDDKDFEDRNLDNYGLIMLLRGMCFRFLGYPLQAQQCFKEKRIKFDTFLSPHSAMELGLTYLSIDDLCEARVWLNRARNDYTGYLLETIVHFRVHCAMRVIKSKVQINTNLPVVDNSPVTTPEVDNELNATPLNSRISSIFMEWSKKISNVTLNTSTLPNKNTEYTQFLDGYQMKL
ncbi:unnamed protein product [Medioppia subpectinata]|uniref:Tetratricopeptide repeat protein 39B n=1 Tax=Medioppia subpectinata TaxID=1979941 RepID=A0A7R9KMB3_9ACAR|nr:unnamed protein product [Medioppia subpectinata]CAG2106204.1 unnamed protein product [Medioppia subpectinata]